MLVGLHCLDGKILVQRNVEIKFYSNFNKKSVKMVKMSRLFYYKILLDKLLCFLYFLKV